jgi:hypothetical protein
VSLWGKKMGWKRFWWCENVSGTLISDSKCAIDILQNIFIPRTLKMAAGLNILILHILWAKWPLEWSTLCEASNPFSLITRSRSFLLLYGKRASYSVWCQHTRPNVRLLGIAQILIHQQIMQIRQLSSKPTSYTILQYCFRYCSVIQYMKILTLCSHAGSCNKYTTGAAKGILRLPHRWQRVVHNAGDYVEGQ